MGSHVKLIAVLLMALATAPGVTRFGLAAARATAQTPPPQTQSNMQDMMKMHEQMMAEMKAGDAKLDALVKAMNSATGDVKTDAVAAVVDELVRQHKSMHGHMGHMHEHMMGRGMMMHR
jgi:polyhydroxyalkanoate synthesis regulator phasin